MTEQPNALKGIPLTIHSVKKTEQVPNKPLEQPKCKTCKDTGQIVRVFHPDRIGEDEMRPCPDCKPEPSPYNAINKPEQPNTELLIVKTIQGLTTCINNELEKLSNENTPYNSKTMDIRDKALEEIDLFEKTTLFELQRCFE